MAVVVTFLAPAAGASPDTGAASAVPSVPGGSSPKDLAALEARAAQLSRQYRGQLLELSGAEGDAKTALARAQRLRRQLADAQRQLARAAAASYMGSGQDPTMAILGSGAGDPGQLLGGASILQYLVQQREAREQALRGLTAAAVSAGQHAEAKIAGLRRLLTALAGRQKAVQAMLDRFRPQSPLIGGTITARMSVVKDEVDRRFGPFSAIGCYRPGTDGEHPLGRACDFMLSTGGVLPSAANVQLGYDIAAWAQANASRLGIMYIIYRQRIWDIRMPSAGWVLMPDNGSITANHFDHVHISVF